MTNQKNIPASIVARLKNVAKQNKKNYDSIFLLYCQERLLYRLSISEYKSKFLLKGGLFLFSLTKFSARPTLDIDFLANYISNEIKNIQKAFIDICSIEVLEDGLVFDIDGITATRIKEEADYEGVRIKVPVSLGRSRKQLQLDIGFGDIIVPKPAEIEFPILLDMENPKILAYSIESVIAEKFEAMVSLSTVNSRMKDFYDIYILSETRNFDGRVLQEAIFETFTRRGTSFEKHHPVFTENFYTDPERNQQWQAFLKRLGIEKSISFESVMLRLNTLLFPIYEVNAYEDEFFKQWDSQLKQWC